MHPSLGSRSDTRDPVNLANGATVSTSEPRLPTRFTLLGFALALCLGFGACSDDSDGTETNRVGTSGPGPASTTSPPEPATDTSEPAAEEPGVAVIAHRGASSEAPELTFAAFDLAVEQGADVLEIDVHMTADGELVLLHDDDLDRTARGPAEFCTGPVKVKTLDELRQCDFGSWFNEEYPESAKPEFVGLAIPTVAEFAERYGTDIGYLIEIKSPEAHPGIEQALLDVLDEAGLTGPPAQGDVVVQSFSADSMKLMHGLRPALPLAQLLSIGAPIDEALLDDISTYAVTIAPLYALVDQAMVDAAHHRCLGVTPWTVDDRAEMSRLFELGVDGLITNVPTVALDMRVDHPAPAAVC